MNNNIKLEKCPFCGGINIEVKHRYSGQGNDSHYAKVVCMDCGASGTEHFIWNDKEDIDKMINSWNTRASS